MIPLRIKFVVTQNTRFAITSQGKSVWNSYFLRERWRSLRKFKTLVLNFRVCQKFDPKIVHCNLNINANAAKRFFGDLDKSRNPRWRTLDQDDHHLEMITQLIRHVTSSRHDADYKGYIFSHTIYPPSLVVLAFIFSELQRGRGGGRGESAPFPWSQKTKKPCLNRVNK